MAAVDASVAPGDDFFAYANGEWLAKARIPDGKARWGARDEINAATAQQLAQVIRGAGALPHGRKVADFHAAYSTKRPSRSAASLRSRRS
jgi:endothelin-converting enzyme/putative endopeptidase